MYSNNPFIDNASNPLSRFPDINAIDRASASSSSSGVVAGVSANYNGYGPSTYGTNGYPASSAGPYVQQQQQQQIPATSYAYAQQQLSPSPNYAGAYNGSPGFVNGIPMGATAGPSMSTMYGAAQSPSATSAYGGGGYAGGYAASVPYGPQQQLNAYPTGYGWGPGPNVAQQQQQTASFLAEFDPYTQIPSSSSSSNTANGSNTNGTANGNNSNWREHPRDYIQKHKRELELWDPVSWKQVLLSFDNLKDAWTTRKAQIATQIRQGGYYISPQESAYLQSLQKDAENHIDSIMASKVQMQEVLSGYRLSNDLASRNRVRESVNSALRELPDWPPVN